ncbi:MAG: hypothetical protein JWM76_3866 [Pseudonocardiales bacterium]|nr:hypothetical protein [Pseudonocardiales bacterium]
MECRSRASHDRDRQGPSPSALPREVIDVKPRSEHPPCTTCEDFPCDDGVHARVADGEPPKSRTDVNPFSRTSKFSARKSECTQQPTASPDVGRATASAHTSQHASSQAKGRPKLGTHRDSGGSQSRCPTGAWCGMTEAADRRPRRAARRGRAGPRRMSQDRERRHQLLDLSDAVPLAKPLDPTSDGPPFGIAVPRVADGEHLRDGDRQSRGQLRKPPGLGLYRAPPAARLERGVNAPPAPPGSPGNRPHALPHHFSLIIEGIPAKATHRRFHLEEP